jgi:hypothetical protein
MGWRLVDGFVDDSRGGLTELRVHGVSGTPPDSMLENPHVTLVSGDSTAGFYRRIWLGGRPSPSLAYADIPGERRREAYAWGGLTSGAGSRALWMLLLPFMLANVAFWMYPAATRPDEPRWRSQARDCAAALQRLFSLSLTVALTLSAVNVATDLAGWQCGGSRACVAQNSFLHFLTLGFFSQPGRRLALATVVPVAVVVLLWLLGNKSWNAYERLQPAAPAEVSGGDNLGGMPPAAGPLGPPIGRRRMWNGAEPVRRMRSLHVCAGFATAGLFLAVPLTSGPHRGVGQTFLALMIVALAGPVIALLLPWLWRRQDPADGTADEEPRLSPDRHDLWGWLPWAALALVTAAVIAALFPNVGPAISAGSLPRLSSFLGWMFVAQIALLILIVAVVATVAASSRGTRDGEPSRAELSGRALAGLGAPVMLLLSWLLAVSFAAGLVVRSADFLGTPAPAGRPPSGPAVLLVPGVYYWAAAAAFCLVVVTGLVAAVVFVLVWRETGKREKGLVARTYKAELSGPGGLPASVHARARMIARAWARAYLTDKSPLLLTILASVLAVAVAASVAGYLATSTVNGTVVRGLWLWQHASWLATAGSWAVAAMAVALIALGRRAYSDPATRRTVGILWDLGTFWPRGTHPLAPPCYCERTLPDLIYRMTWLAPRDQDLVVLSTHSQGTVIGAALVLQLDPSQQTRTAFITYGSPLQRLYSRFFPAYFGARVLSQIGEALTGTASDQASDRSRWPWRNLFRASDPIGGPVRHGYMADETLYDPDVIAALANGQPPGGDNGDVDRQFLDPPFNRADGNTAYPQTLGHSGYFEDPYFPGCVDTVIQLARQRLVSFVPGSDSGSDGSQTPPISRTDYTEH